MPSLRASCVTLRTACTLALFSIAAAEAVPAFSQTARTTREAGGITVQAAGQYIRLEVVSDCIVHVTAAATQSALTSHPSFTIVATPLSTRFKVDSRSGGAVLSTSCLKVRVDAVTGAVSFADTATGAPILAEAARTFTPATVQGEATAHVQQQWQPVADESLLGLGQQQLGIVDLKGYDLDLFQHNTNVVVPFLVSSKGYGVFWDNTSYTRFGDLSSFEPIPAYDLFDAKGSVGGLTFTYPGLPTPPTRTSALSFDFHPQPGVRTPPNMQWEGTFEPHETGDYQFRANSNGGIKVTIDGKVVMNHWRQGWLAADDQVRMPLTAGKHYSIRIETDGENQSRMRLLWKPPVASTGTSLWSEVGDRVDYSFVYGPSLDAVVAGYRQLTGRAVMMPQWIFGLWQSRQRYETAKQSLDVVDEFRARKIPFDTIVQDWQYWKPDSWGSHEFDATRFPDPQGWIDAIHARHAHLMISVWGKFNPNTENAKQMQAAGYLYQPDLDEHLTDWIGYPYTFYDAFSAGARKLFWAQLDKALFSKGVDAWWMDASEPDLLPGEPPATVADQKAHLDKTALGTGARVLNAWSLENAAAIYDGQRRSAPNQRVFTLTRSGYAGQQRYAAATWSGDVTSTWTAFQKQITAGLGISIAGVPYWTTDTAGYTMQSRFQAHPTVANKPEDEEEFRELNARWFEFSTFTPLLRVHGEVRPREIWNLGGESAPVYQAELKFDRIRYRLFPYIYSLAGAVTQQGATIMRPLVMDFPQDVTARTLVDEFMFGPQMLVAPVTHFQERSRTVYLPGKGPWFDLWTGRQAAAPTGAGALVQADAPYDSIPVYVRGGSILPLGPDVQYIGEKPAAPLTLHIFAGADGHFTLYEDDGLTFDYEKGGFAQIPLQWTEATQTLTIGARQGRFAGMQTARDFNVLLTTASRPTPFSLTPQPLRTIHYDGTAVTVHLP